MTKDKKPDPTKWTHPTGASSSLSEALELARKAARTGFDWPNLAGVLRKLDEEIEELKEACSTGKREKIEEELGDLLFVIVNIARFQRIHPEKALGKTVRKFKTRFRYIEASLQKRGKLSVNPTSPKWTNYGKKPKR